jgi:hypothetical protein
MEGITKIVEIVQTDQVDQIAEVVFSNLVGYSDTNTEQLGGG